MLRRSTIAEEVLRSQEETTETVSLWQGALAHLDRLEQHLLGEVLIFANLIQVPAAILTGAIAWLVCRPIQCWLVGWMDQLPEGQHLDWIASHRSWITHRVVPLITPVAWVIGLRASVGLLHGRHCQVVGLMDVFDHAA